jgi:hypothetical protein
MTASPRSLAPLDRDTLGAAYAVALEAYLARPEESTLSGGVRVRTPGAARRLRPA